MNENVSETKKEQTYQFITTDGLIINVTAESFVEAAKKVREAYYD